MFTVVIASFLIRVRMFGSLLSLTGPADVLQHVSCPFAVIDFNKLSSAQGTVLLQL